MTEGKKQYWIRFADMLSADSELDRLIPKVLKGLCEEFDFGCGFVYEADHYGLFHLSAGYAGYDGCVMEKCVPLAKELGGKLLAQFAAQPVVTCRAEDKKGPLETELGRVFDAQSIMLTMEVDTDGSPLALIGLVDRRGHSRHAKEDIDFARSVLTTLGTYLKMVLYRRRAEDAQKSLEGTLDNMGIDVYVNDFETHEILYLNRSMAAPYGGVEALLGRPCWQALYTDKTGECDFCPQKKLLDEDGNPTKVYSWDYQRPFDGAWFRVFSAAFRWVDGRMAHIVTSVDITENKRNEEIIRQIAEYDHLTGLPNRYHLTRDIEATMAAAKKEGDGGYLLFFDLDGFKAVNDTLGHEKGDELLVRIGEALQANPLTRGRSYRFGGDEFIIACDDDGPGTVAEVIAAVQEIFESPWQLGGNVVNVGASIGASRFPDDDDTSGGLIRMADMAMYDAKRAGRGRVHFYNKGNIIPADTYFNRENV